MANIIQAIYCETLWINNHIDIVANFENFDVFIKQPLLADREIERSCIGSSGRVKGGQRWRQSRTEWNLKLRQSVDGHATRAMLNKRADQEWREWQMDLKKQTCSRAWHGT